MLAFTLSTVVYTVLFNFFYCSLDNRQSLIVQKVEPWNSVRVTVKIPKDAAGRLKQLAESEDQMLRELGILAVQIDGQKTIPLIVTYEQDHSKAPEVNIADNRPAFASPLFDDGDLSEPQNLDTTRQNIVRYLGEQENSAYVSLDVLHGKKNNLLQEQQNLQYQSDCMKGNWPHQKVPYSSTDSAEYMEIAFRPNLSQQQHQHQQPIMGLSAPNVEDSFPFPSFSGQRLLCQSSFQARSRLPWGGNSLRDGCMPVVRGVASTASPLLVNLLQLDHSSTMQQQPRMLTPYTDEPALKKRKPRKRKNASEETQCLPSEKNGFIVPLPSHTSEATSESSIQHIQEASNTTPQSDSCINSVPNVNNDLPDKNASKDCAIGNMQQRHSSSSSAADVGCISGMQSPAWKQGLETANAATYQFHPQSSDNVSHSEINGEMLEENNQSNMTQTIVSQAYQYGNHMLFSEAGASMNSSEYANSRYAAQQPHVQGLQQRMVLRPYPPQLYNQQAMCRLRMHYGPSASPFYHQRSIYLGPHGNPYRPSNMQRAVVPGRSMGNEVMSSMRQRMPLIRQQYDPSWAGINGPPELSSTSGYTGPSASWQQLSPMQDQHALFGSIASHDVATDDNCHADISSLEPSLMEDITTPVSQGSSEIFSNMDIHSAHSEALTSSPLCRYNTTSNGVEQHLSAQLSSETESTSETCRNTSVTASSQKVQESPDSGVENGSDPTGSKTSPGGSSCLSFEHINHDSEELSSHSFDDILETLKASDREINAAKASLVCDSNGSITANAINGINCKPLAADLFNCEEKASVKGHIDFANALALPHMEKDPLQSLMDRFQGSEKPPHDNAINADHIQVPGQREDFHRQHSVPVQTGGSAVHFQRSASCDQTPEFPVNTVNHSGMFCATENVHIGQQVPMGTNGSAHNGNMFNSESGVLENENVMSNMKMGTSNMSLFNKNPCGSYEGATVSNGYEKYASPYPQMSPNTPIRMPYSQPHVMDPHCVGSAEAEYPPGYFPQVYRGPADGMSYSRYPADRRVAFRSQFSYPGPVANGMQQRFLDHNFMQTPHYQSNTWNERFPCAEYPTQIHPYENRRMTEHSGYPQFNRSFSNPAYGPDRYIRFDGPPGQMGSMNDQWSNSGNMTPSVMDQPFRNAAESVTKSSKKKRKPTSDSTSLEGDIKACDSMARLQATIDSVSKGGDSWLPKSEFTDNSFSGSANNEVISKKKKKRRVKKDPINNLAQTQSDIPINTFVTENCILKHETLDGEAFNNVLSVNGVNVSLGTVHENVNESACSVQKLEEVGKSEQITLPSGSSQSENGDFVFSENLSDLCQNNNTNDLCSEIRKNVSGCNILPDSKVPLNNCSDVTTCSSLESKNVSEIKNSEAILPVITTISHESSTISLPIEANGLVLPSNTESIQSSL